MHRSLTSVALVAALASFCHAQEALDARETAFVDAVSKVAGRSPLELEKESDSEGTILEMEFSDAFELRLVRYADPDMAREAAGMAAMYSSMGDAPSLIELRGGDVLIVEGPLAEGDLAQQMRAAAWTAFPWDDGSKSVSLLMLNLLEDGMALRTSSKSAELYRHLQGLVNQAIDEAQDPDPDSVITVISPREVTMTQDERRGHVKLTDAAGIQVVSNGEPKPVLVAFAKLVELPLPEAKQAGAAQALGAIGE